jgi:hypothetical protein
MQALSAGAPITLAVDPPHLHFFAEDGQALGR